MSSSLTITCPKCKATFDAGDAFNEHFKSAQIENDQKKKEAKRIVTEEVEKNTKSKQKIKKKKLLR